MKREKNPGHITIMTEGKKGSIISSVVICTLFTGQNSKEDTYHYPD